MSTIPARELTRPAFRPRLDRLPLPPDALAGDLRQLARSFCRSLEDRDCSPHTIRGWASSLRMFGVFLAEQGMPTVVANITSEHVREFFRSLRDAGLSDNTRAGRYRALVAFFKWLVEEDEIRARDNPITSVKPPKIAVPPPPIISDDDVSALLATCKGNDFRTRRDYAIIRLLFDIGVRRSGLAYARVQDVDLDHYPPTVTIVGKGRYVYTAAIGKKTAAALDRYLRLRARHKHADSEALWLGREGALSDNTIDAMLRTRAAEAGVKGIHAHAFRHKFAHDQLSDPEVKEGDVLQQGGWRDPKMLQRYARAAAAERAQLAHARRDLSSRL